MTKSSAAQITEQNTENIYNLEQKRVSVVKGREFAPLLMTFLRSKLFSSTENLILSIIAKDSGYRDSVYTLAELGDIVNKSADTIKGILKRLATMGMIQTTKAARNQGVIITRTLLWNEPDPARLRQAVEQFAEANGKQTASKRQAKEAPQRTAVAVTVTEDAVKKAPNPTKRGQISDKHTMPPSKPAKGGGKNHRTPALYLISEKYKDNTTPPTAQRPPIGKKSQSKIDLFTPSQIKLMSNHAEQIAKCCKDILQLPARPGIAFNPYQAVGKSLKMRKQPGAIAETLIGMVKNWQTIDQPWKIYEYQLKIKNQNYNAADAERQAARHKSGLKDFLKSFAMGFGFNPCKNI